MILLHVMPQRIFFYKKVWLQEIQETLKAYQQEYFRAMKEKNAQGQERDTGDDTFLPPKIESNMQKIWENV